MDALEELCTPEEVGDYLKVSPITIREWCREGKIPGAVKVGWLWRIPRAAVMRMREAKPA
jgi:excisionase family DNA binding protein